MWASLNYCNCDQCNFASDRRDKLMNHTKPKNWGKESKFFASENLSITCIASSATRHFSELIYRSIISEPLWSRQDILDYLLTSTWQPKKHFGQRNRKIWISCLRRTVDGHLDEQLVPPQTCILCTRAHARQHCTSALHKRLVHNIDEQKTGAQYWCKKDWCATQQTLQCTGT